jgi:pilus assembly protein CpaB
MKNRRRVLGVVLAFVLAVIGAVALVSYSKKGHDDNVAAGALTNVYIVDKVIPKGSGADVVTASVEQKQIPANLVQSGNITPSDVGDKTAAVDLLPGEQLVAGRFVTKAQTDAPADKVQVSAKLDAERAVGGTLVKGDTVGVYLSFEPFDTNKPETDTTTPPKTPSMTHLEFQQVLVTNVQTADATTDKAGAVTSGQFIVTLALSPAQSERFVFATEFGHVWLSNEPATVTDDGTALTTLGSIYAVVK